MSPATEVANTILSELDLLDYLVKFGEVQVVGSVALDLIVKPDLDLHLLIEAENLIPTVHTITSYLLDQPKIREVRITDWREENGIKIGVDAYPVLSETWSIDIWVTNDRRATAFDFVKQLNASLTADQRQAILKIKEYFYSLGQLRDGLSLKIYRAVLDLGIQTVEEFLLVPDENFF